MKKHHVDAGLAILELSILSMGLFLLLIGATLMHQRYHQFGEASRIVDRYLHDDVVHPLRFEEFGGAFEIAINDEELSSYMVSMVASAAAEIQELIERFELSGIYQVQMGYRVVELNTATGEVENLLEISCVEQSNSQGLTQNALCPALSSAIESYSEAETEEEVSLFAAPTAYFGRAGDSDAQARYLPYAVLIGVRVAWSLERSDGNRMNPFGFDPEVSDQKVTVLRGDFAL